MALTIKTTLLESLLPGACFQKRESIFLVINGIVVSEVYSFPPDIIRKDYWVFSSPLNKAPGLVESLE